MRLRWSGLIGAELGQGEIEAANEAAAKVKLENDGVTVFSLETISDSKSTAVTDLNLSKVDKLPLEKVLELSEKLEVMLGAGLSFSQVMELLREQAQKDDLVFITYLQEQMERGSSLSSVFQAFPRSFDAVYVSLIKAGEMSGNLDAFFGRARQYIASKIETKKKIKKALTYPLTLAVVAAAVVAVMLIYVVPVFAKMFASSNTALPAPTQIVLNISYALRDPLFLAQTLIPTLTTVWLFKRQYRNSWGFKLAFDKFLLRVPVIKRALVTIHIHTISMINANLFSAGVSLVDGLEIAAEALPNAVYKEATGAVRESIISGSTIKEAFNARPDLFPKTFTALVQVGEQTGSLGRMLESSSNVFKKEFDDSMAAVIGLIEPIMISVMGLVIGFILIAMYSPMFSLGSAI